VTSTVTQAATSTVASAGTSSVAPSFAPTDAPSFAPSFAPAPPPPPCTGQWVPTNRCGTTVCGTQACLVDVYQIPAGSGPCPYAQGTELTSTEGRLALGAPLCRLCRTPECPTAAGCIKSATNSCGITCPPGQSWGWGGTQSGWICSSDDAGG
jgi:hypothetical protein